MIELVYALSSIGWPGGIALAAMAIGAAWVLVTIFKNF